MAAFLSQQSRQSGADDSRGSREVDVAHGFDLLCVPVLSAQRLVYARAEYHAVNVGDLLEDGIEALLIPHIAGRNVRPVATSYKWPGDQENFCFGPEKIFFIMKNGGTLWAVMFAPPNQPNAENNIIERTVIKV